MAYSDEVLADGPLIYLPMQETSGTVATDLSGNSRNGTYVNGATVNDTTDLAAWVTLGKHVRLDGTDDHVLLPGGSWFNPATAGFTFEGWYLDRAWANWQRVFDFGVGAVEDANTLYLAANNANQMQLKIGGSLTLVWPRWSTGDWHHIVLTVTAAGAAIVYVDKAVVASGTVGPPTAPTRNTMYLGRSQYADPYLQASLCHVSLYNKVLSAARIGAHFDVAAFTGVTESHLFAQGAGVLFATPSRDSRLYAQSAAVLYATASRDSQLFAQSAAVLVPTRWDTEVLLAGTGSVVELDNTSPTPRAITLDRPQNIPIGSLLLAHVWYRGPIGSLVVPAGWTVESGPFAGGLGAAVLCSRLALSSDPTSWTWNTGDESGWRGGGRIVAFGPPTVIDAIAHQESTTANVTTLPTPPVTFLASRLPSAVFVATHVGFGDYNFVAGSLAEITDGQRFAQYWAPGMAPGTTYNPPDITGANTQSSGYVTFTVALRSGIPSGAPVRTRTLTGSPKVTHRATATLPRARRAWRQHDLKLTPIDASFLVGMELVGGNGLRAGVELDVRVALHLDVVPSPVLPAIQPVYWMRVSETYPNPNAMLLAYDRPDPDLFKPTSTVTDVIGRPFVRVGGRDMTYWRNVPVEVLSWEEAEPWGWTSATIRWPHGTLITVPSEIPLAKGQAFDLGLADENSHFLRWLFRGFVAEVVRDEVSCTVTAVGNLRETLYAMHQPPFFPSLTDNGKAIAAALNGVVSRRFAHTNPVTTGISTARRGTRSDTVYSFVTGLLSLMTTDDGLHQWTLMPTDALVPTLRLKNTTTQHWTVTAGQRGVSIRLTDDVLEDPNVIYGSGIDTDRQKWDNSRWPGSTTDLAPPYPNSNPANTIRQGEDDSDTSNGKGVSQLQARLTALGFTVAVTGSFGSKTYSQVKAFQRSASIQVDGIVGGQTWNALWPIKGNLGTPFFLPLAAVNTVLPRKYDSSGNDIGANPAYDPNRFRVEKFYAFGDGVSRSQAQDWAEGLIRRNQTIPNVLGTIDLRADPQEGSRRFVRAGQNIRVRGYGGTATGVLLHVVTVQHTEEQTSLGVDARARDALELAQIVERNRDAVDPARRILQDRESLGDHDLSPWHSEPPAGIIPRTAVWKGLWSVMAVPMGAYGQVVRTIIQTSPATGFAVAVFSRPVTSNWLKGVVGNPLAETSSGFGALQEEEKKLAKNGYLMGWGMSGQAMGFEPAETSSSGGSGTLTGYFEENASWEFAAYDRGHLYLAVYANKSTYVQGRLFVDLPYDD